MTNERKQIRAKYAKRREERQKQIAKRKFKRSGGVFGVIVGFFAPTWFAL